MQVASRVRRVASHLFGVRADDAVAELLRYGAKGEAERVHLAILKLSAGDLGKLEREIEVARIDDRDVLAPAESPRRRRLGSPRGPLDRVRARLAEWRDPREHAAWLRQVSSTRPKR